MHRCFLFIVFLLSAGSLFAQQGSIDRIDLLQYEGTYEFPGGRRVTLGVFDEFNKSLVYLDLKSLKQGALVPIAADRFRENNDEKLIFEFVRAVDGTIGSVKVISGEKIKDGRRVMSLSSLESIKVRY